ncbi:permease [Gemmatirosa kalamazoonensis]|uniref:Permease n=1 Tax=Gemmatirosa kalamazoonensis TaxID=861299 RepID=W0RBY4_9BACT|nr:permease [Gemmatirosa kalamazoonensis]
MFGVVNAVLLRAFPFHEPERLVALYEYAPRGKDDRMPLSAANFRDWRDGSHAFASMALVTDAAFTLRSDPSSGASEPERISGARASAGLWQTLGAPLALGRGYTADEDLPGAAPVAVISHSLWQRRFGGDRGIVGRTMTLNDAPTTIVGVLSPDFRFPLAQSTDVVMPFRWDEKTWNRRGNHFASAVARLRPGVTVSAAQADLQTIADRIARDYPEMQKGWGARVVPLHEAVVSGARSMLLLLMGAVGAVLLIGCANVANLTLARVAAKQRATAVRAAIGAGRAELVRQHLAESVVLGIAGGAAGLALASLISRALPSLVPTEIPRISDAGVDWRVAAFTFAVSVAASVIAGLVPAWQGSRADLAEVLRDGNKGSTAGAARARSRDMLFVAEVALSLLLLAGAGLALKSFAKLLAIQPGFAPERVLVGRVQLPRLRYADSLAQTRFWDAALQRLRETPGVRAAGATSFLPLGGDEAYGAYGIRGRPVDVEHRMMAQFQFATDGYFDAMGIPLRRGRVLSTDDRAGTPLVAVVNEALAQAHFPGEDPIGQEVQPFGEEGPAFRIVGIVGNVKHRALTDSLRPQIYFPSRQLGSDAGWFVVRGTGSPETLAGALRREVHAVDPTLAIADVQPMRGVVATSVARQRFLAQLLGGFAVSALVLALVGIYGVVANTVVQRSGEFGIRVALGATRGDVQRDVLGGSLARTALGLAIGLGGALVAGRALATQLYDVRITDPVVLGGIAVLLVAAALLASWVPARRATRVDPMRVLRSE